MKKRDEIQIRDPYIVVENGTYYLFGTTDTNAWGDRPGTGFDAYSSKDLEHWEGPFSAFRPPEGFWGTMNFWAPEVHPVDGAYYMFASFRGMKVHRGTAVLRAESILGPYLPWSDGAVTPAEWECLDGTLYFSQDKTPYLVFCHEWTQISDGTICAMELSRDLRRGVSEPVELFAASQADWVKPFAFEGHDKLCRITDGPYLYSGKNGLYLLWSSSGQEGYAIGCALSPSGNLMGPWKQLEQPLFQKDGGHGMLFTDLNGNLCLTIHSPNETPLERPVFFQVEERENGLFRKS